MESNAADHNQTNAMSYRVDYTKLAYCGDGKVGNIPQGDGHIFTDVEIKDIPQLLNEWLSPKYVGIIKKIENVGGTVLMPPAPNL